MLEMLSWGGIAVFPDLTAALSNGEPWVSIGVQGIT
jgi:hypothetical protein